jgi:hypothetical protein
MALGSYSKNTMRAQRAGATIFQSFCVGTNAGFLPAAPVAVRVLIEDCHLLCARFEVKHQFIDAHRRSHDVRSLCIALEVSRSGYYAAP